MKVMRPNGLKIGIMSSIFFGTFMALFAAGYARDMSIAVKMFFLGGITFGVTIYKFMEKLSRKNRDIPEDLKHETMLAHGAANHYAGLEVRGGWLYLSRENLTFKSHKLNLQNADLKIPLAEIGEAGPFNQFGFVANGIEVRLRSGAKERFVVSDRSSWLDEINNAKGT